MNAPHRIDTSAAKPAHQWAHAPSPFAWSVLIYGGENPCTGREQPPYEVQFHRRKPGGSFGYSLLGILYRANDFARAEWRTHFAVRDSDGSIVYDGPVVPEHEVHTTFKALAKREDDAEFRKLVKGQEAFRKMGGGR